MESLWRKQIGNLSLKEDTAGAEMTDNHYDVIVVGAGMAGLLIAYYLKEQGRNVLVL